MRKRNHRFGLKKIYFRLKQDEANTRQHHGKACGEGGSRTISLKSTTFPFTQWMSVRETRLRLNLSAEDMNIGQPLLARETVYSEFTSMMNPKFLQQGSVLGESVYKAS